MNGEFQRMAKRDKKAFLSEQHKQIEENNRMGMNRNSFKKIGDIKGTLCKDGHNRQNGKGLTELEEIKKCQEYPEVLYKKVLMTQVITVVWSLT